MAKSLFNDGSYLKRGGTAGGKFMGRPIQNIADGLAAFGKLGMGMVNEAITLGSSAIKAAIKVAERSVTKPFALDARDMASAAEEFKKNSTAKATAPPAKKRATFAPGLRPATP